MDDTDRLSDVSRSVIGLTVVVHRELGQRLLESAYEACLVFQLSQRGLRVEGQKPLPLRYLEMTPDCGHRLDLLVEDAHVVEVKAVEALAPIRKAQLLSYLRLGLLLDFNVVRLKDGIQWVVNSFPEAQRPQRSLR